MKKFEEELKDNNLEILVSNRGSSLYGQSYVNYDKIVELSNGWISPEDHQAEIGKIELQNLKYREEIARMQKSLRKKNKAIKELNGAVKKIKLDRDEWKTEANQLDKEKDRLITETEQLKSQIGKQQPEIPEVPQFVADWYEKVSSIFLEACIFDFILSNPQGGADASSEFEKWFMENNNSIEILIDMKRLGYTVAKEKRFYLKHKSVLVFDPDMEDSDVEELYLGAAGNFVPYQHLAKIFTQSQIDSMETGSYEQIEVQE